MRRVRSLHRATLQRNPRATVARGVVLPPLSAGGHTRAHTQVGAHRCCRSMLIHLASFAFAFSFLPSIFRLSFSPTIHINLPSSFIVNILPLYPPSSFFSPLPPPARPCRPTSWTSGGAPHRPPGSSTPPTAHRAKRSAPPPSRPDGSWMPSQCLPAVRSHRWCLSSTPTRRGFWAVALT